MTAKMHDRRENNGQACQQYYAWFLLSRAGQLSISCPPGSRLANNLCTGPEFDRPASHLLRIRDRLAAEWRAPECDGTVKK